MGYLVEVRGKVRLPAALEAEAVAALREALLAADGWLDEEQEVSSLADLSGWVAAATTRDGDWVEFRPDEEGDPKWSDQATAFYVGLGRWVEEGQIDVEGEDDERWSYRYGPDGVEQLGVNGYDGGGSGDDLGSEQRGPEPVASRGSPVAAILGFLRRRR